MCEFDDGYDGGDVDCGSDLGGDMDCGSDWGGDTDDGSDWGDDTDDGSDWGDDGGGGNGAPEDSDTGNSVDPDGFDLFFGQPGGDGFDQVFDQDAQGDGFDQFFGQSGSDGMDQFFGQTVEEMVWTSSSGRPIILDIQVRQVSTFQILMMFLPRKFPRMLFPKMILMRKKSATIRLKNRKIVLT